jgi:short-chain fatty acids transporter
MVSRLGLWISGVFRRVVPDPLVIAIALSVLVFLAALAFGTPPAVSPGSPEPGLAQRAAALFDAWRGSNGLWRFLAFGMQMCLILVTGYALAESRPVRRVLDHLAQRPRSARGAVGLVALVACVTGLLNWGLGLIVGAILARDVARAMARKGVRVHFPLLVAAGYMGLLIWHGGLSGSAPLTMTTLDGALKVLPKSTVELIGNKGVPLTDTLFSTLNLVVTGGLLVILPLTLMALHPGAAADVQVAPVTNDAGEADAHDEPAPLTVPDRLDTSRVIAWLLGVPLVLAVIRYAVVQGAWSISINEVIALMFGLGLILHGSVRSYARAAEDGAGESVGVILQFPIYAGIAALFEASGLVGTVSDAMSAWIPPTLLPLATFLSATVVGLFIPSGGGQWGVQGPVALASAMDVGVAPGTIVMAVAYGDQAANMLQPFWALPLLAITGAKARDIVGYTAIAMLVMMVWTAIGLVALG